MYIEIAPDGAKFKVVKHSSDRKVVVDYHGSLTPADCTKAAKALGVPEFLINQLLKQFGVNPKDNRLSLTATPTCVFTTRLEHGDEKQAHATFDAALAKVGRKDVIEWGCARTSCILDLDDYGNDSCSTAGSLLRYHSAIWESHSRTGFHAVYTHDMGFDAIELAAMDAYRIQLVYPDAKVELITKTRAPAHEVTKHESKRVAEYLEEHAAGTWLQNNSYSVGQRITHAHCPVNASPRSLGKVPPIELREHYVHCYICEADGIKMGSKHPGRFPYSVLSGDHRPTKLSSLIEGLVHYGHGKYAVYATGVVEPVARNLYSGLLKAKHGVDDPRIASVFTAGEPIGIVRYQGYWSDDSGTALVLDKSSPILKSLPASQSVDRKGNAAANATQLEWLSQPIDLARIGYIPVVAINGIQMTMFQSTDSIQKVYKIREGKNPPKYLPPDKRIHDDDAWRTIERVFPKLNRKAITALIVGRGCSEIRVGLPPMLFLSGSTGTGKSSHTMVAAAICGDTCTPVFLNADRDRFDNEFLTAKSRSGFVLFDEFFKYAKQARMSEVEAMQGLLKYGNDQMAYKIYIGAVPMGDMPMLVWADSSIPPEVMQHEQIGRRVYHLKLGTTLDWEKPLAEHGIFEPKKLRDNGSPDILLACNSLLSGIIDKWFTGPATDYTTCMDELGIKKLNCSEEITAKNNLIRDLFDVICSRPEIKENSDKKRFSGKGFKIAKVDVGNDPLFLAYDMLQSDREKRTTACRILAETDLSRVLKSEHVVEFQIRKHGAKYAMRFVSECGRFVNRELLSAD